MSEGPEWFAPKRYGYGSGMPISWQGWAVTLGFAAVVAALIAAFSRPAVRARRCDRSSDRRFMVIVPGPPAAAGAGAGERTTSRPKGRAAG